MGNCETCLNAIFNELWGEYKCKVYQHTVYFPEELTGCKDYKKGTPSISKDDEVDYGDI